MPIDYEKRDGVAYITLNNPTKANILDKKTSDEISRIWIDLWKDRERKAPAETARAAHDRSIIYAADRAHGGL